MWTELRDQAGKPAERLVRLQVAAIEAEAVALTLDAAREHMGCACSGIEGHLAERGLLFKEEQP
jgi:hypothetical protein